MFHLYGNILKKYDVGWLWIIKFSGKMEKYLCVYVYNTEVKRSTMMVILLLQCDNDDEDDGIDAQCWNPLGMVFGPFGFSHFDV